MNGDFQHAYYPVFFDLQGRLAVVVGSATGAETAVIRLLRYGADVLVIASEVSPALDVLVAEGVIEHEQREYVRGDLSGAFMVVCASPSLETSRAVYQEAEGHGCLVTHIELPELSNCTTPAVVRRGPFQIAVSTAGAAPNIARRISRELERTYEPEWAEYMMLLGGLRHLIMERAPGGDSRHEEMFDELADSDLMDRIRAGERLTAEDLYREYFVGSDEHDVPAPGE